MTLEAKLKELGLTEGEIEVALLTLENLSEQQISDRVFRSKLTIKWRKERLYPKLGVKTKFELIKKLMDMTRDLNQHSSEQSNSK